MMARKLTVKEVEYEIEGDTENGLPYQDNVVIMILDPNSALSGDHWDYLVSVRDVSTGQYDFDLVSGGFNLSQGVALKMARDLATNR